MMSVEKSSKAFRAKTVPSYNISIENYWGDIYESVFCYFKPFYKTSSYDWFNNIQINNLKDLELFYEENSKLSWKELALIFNFDSDISLFERYIRCNQNKEQIFSGYSEYILKNCIIEPFFDGFSPYQLYEIVDLFESLGYSNMLIYSDFDQKENAKMIENEIKILKKNLFDFDSIQSIDSKLFIGNGFDYFTHSYICGNKDFIQLIMTQVKLEGFICDMKSDIWYPSPLVQPK